MWITEAVDIDGYKSIIKAKNNRVYKDDIKLEEGDMHRTPYPCKVIKVAEKETQEVVFPKKFGNRNYRPRMQKCSRCLMPYMKAAPAHVFCGPCRKAHTKARQAHWIREKRRGLTSKKCRDITCSTMTRVYVDIRKSSGFCKSCAAIKKVFRRTLNKINYL